MKKRNILFSILVASILGLTQHEALAATQEELVTWTEQQIGVSHVGAFGAQCVDLIRVYIQEFYGMNTSGNAIDYAVNQLPEQLVRVDHDDPIAGDILVMTSSVPEGHVAIITSVDSQGVHVVGQNQSSGNYSGAPGSRMTLSWEQYAQKKVTLIRESGWRKDTTGDFYQQKDGSRLKNTWKKIDGKWYHFDEQGYWQQQDSYQEELSILE